MQNIRRHEFSLCVWNSIALSITVNIMYYLIMSLAVVSRLDDLRTEMRPFAQYADLFLDLECTGWQMLKSFVNTRPRLKKFVEFPKKLYYDLAPKFDRSVDNRLEVVAYRISDF